MSDIKSTSDDFKKGRKDFLKLLLSLGAGVGIASVIKNSNHTAKTGKVKMLTPDGNLVEIDMSKIEKEVTTHRATNDEILKWVETNKSKS